MEAISTNDRQKYTPFIVDKARADFRRLSDGRKEDWKIISGYAQHLGANIIDITKAWAKRPKTPGKLFRTFYLNHEMGHAIVAMHEGIPIKGIGFDGGPAGESGAYASSLILDWGRLGIPWKKGTPADYVKKMTKPLEILGGKSLWEPLNRSLLGGKVAVEALYPGLYESFPEMKTSYSTDIELLTRGFFYFFHEEMRKTYPDASTDELKQKFDECGDPGSLAKAEEATKIILNEYDSKYGLFDKVNEFSEANQHRFHLGKIGIDIPEEELLEFFHKLDRHLIS
jgi:hypothetical protein